MRLRRGLSTETLHRQNKATARRSKSPRAAKALATLESEEA